MPEKKKINKLPLFSSPNSLVSQVASKSENKKQKKTKTHTHTQSMKDNGLFAQLYVSRLQVLIFFKNA